MTPLPSIPTDNLYKFQFIAGITMILFSLTVGITTILSNEKSYNDLELSIKQDSLEVVFLVEDKQQLILENNNLLHQINKIKYNINPSDSLLDVSKLLDKIYSNKKYRDYLGFLEKYENYIFAHKVNQKKIVQNSINLLKLTRDMQRKLTIKKFNIGLLKIQHTYMKYFLYVLLTIIIIGGFIADRGYRNWETLVQKPLDLKLKIEIEQLQNNILKVVKDE